MLVSVLEFRDRKGEFVVVVVVLVVVVVEVVNETVLELIAPSKLG